MIRYIVKTVLMSLLLTVVGFYFLLQYLHVVSHEAQTKAQAKKSMLDAMDQEMVLHFLNLEIGKSTLIQMGKIGILIDVGHKNDSSTLLAYLDSQNINKITHIFLSNGLEENMSGIQDIIRHFPAATVYLPEATQQDYLLPDTIPFKTIRAGDQLFFSKDFEISMQILSPFAPIFQDPNNDSMVSMLSYRKIRILLTNDIHEEAEARLLNTYPSLQAEIMTVPDRPSGVTHSRRFINEINPQTAIMVEVPCKDCKRVIQHAAKSYSEEWSDFFFVPVDQNLLIYFNNGEYMTPKNQLE